MFAPGDYVIYSVEGVCRVDEAGQLNVPGLERRQELLPPDALLPRRRDLYARRRQGGDSPGDDKAGAAGAVYRSCRGCRSWKTFRRTPASWQAFTARYLRLMTAEGSCSCARRCSTSSVSLRRSAKPSVRPSFAAGKPPRRCFIRSLPSSSACSQPRSKPIWKQHSPPEHPKSRTQGFSACGLSFFFDYLRSFSKSPLRRSAGAIAA